jgi:IS30 family transposase
LPPPQSVEATFLVKECFMVFAESSYETRDQFLTRVCSGWSLTRAAAEVGMSSPWSVKWWRRLGPMDLKPCKGRGGGLGLPAFEVWPAASSDRPKTRRALSLLDRQVIAAGLRLGMTQAVIAEFLGRCKSVISREVSRHRAADGNYYALLAATCAAIDRARPKQFKLHANPALCRRIEAWMDDGWSPQLIARVLAAEPAATKMDRVSHETIYKALYVQSRGQLRKDLYRKLSLRRKQRKARGTARQDSLYRHAFKISDRPAEVADRAVPGHWEGDLILGAGNGSAVGTLVERTTRFVILLHLPNGHDADEVAAAMIREMSKLPEHLRRSITYDRGTEMARYADIQLALNLPIYFCNPASPWQRGSNENTNRLLRFWLPKGGDLSVFTADDLDQIAAKLNARPRPTLDLRTPADCLNELLHHNQQVA